MYIKNSEELLSHGNIAGRRIVLDILEAALHGPDAAYENTRRVVRIEDGNLILGDPEFSEPRGQKPVTYRLSDINNIYIVGAGKAVQKIGQALEDIFGDRITEAQFNLKKGEPVILKHIPVTHAGHPIPDEDSVIGAEKMVSILKKAKKGDIVFWCSSGGSTALLSLPHPSITLQDLQQVYRILYFECGATMPESNAVRNLLVTLQNRHPRIVEGAILVQLAAPENPLIIRAHKFDQISLVNTYGRAIDVLQRYECWDRIPRSVRDYLLRGDLSNGFPTPEELKQRPYFIYRVMGPEYLIEAARKKSEIMGLRTAVLATSLNDVEARPLAEVLANIAMEVEAFGRPFVPPCVMLCGGEAVVTMGKATGLGGRNKELVLAMAPIIDKSQNVTIGSVDSDGTDGPTQTAGGIADGFTFERINQAGIDLNTELKNHNSSFVLDKLNDVIVTGATSTNMRDIRVIYVGGRLAGDRGSIV